ncbi:hypothetical protein N9S81_00120 [bacterium]|nr:hypothetical protein [bacterium]
MQDNKHSHYPIVTPSTDTLNDEWKTLASQVANGVAISAAANHTTKGARDMETVYREHENICSDIKQLISYKIETFDDIETSDERVLSYERFTDGLPYKNYEKCIHSVPELVNLVSLADAIPNTPGVMLPFDLTAIAKRCKGASLFFAPRSFTAVQFAAFPPRSRVLLFRTR